VEQSGAGLSLPPAEATADRLRDALHDLLLDGPRRSRAIEIGHAYGATDGSARTAELLVGL
jgi:UDP:flavonoid glycosyltransferase YjiC (YdhE family)